MKNKMHLIAAGIMACLLVMVGAFGANAEEGLVNEHSVEQTDFNLRAYELLRDEDLEELEGFVQAVQDCPEDIPANNLEYWCTKDRADNKYVQHVKDNTQWWKESQQIISIDRGLYIALTELYKDLYNAPEKKFDIKNYRDFYNRYKGTWLESRVEQTLTQLWQDGGKYTGSVAGMPFNGKQIYNTLYISHIIPFDNPFRYVGKHIYMDKWSTRNNHDRFGKRLKEMRTRSEETNSLPLLYEIKRAWRDSLLQSETEEESVYYQGTKQQRMFEFFDWTGWAMFADKENPPSEWERHTVSLYCRVCPRKYSEEVCKRFIGGAKEYGYYDESVALPPAEYAARQARREARLKNPKGI